LRIYFESCEQWSIWCWNNRSAFDSIAVLGGFLPVEFMFHAEIGSLPIHSYLAQWEGMVDHVGGH
jgi:hypothetical protein